MNQEELEKKYGMSFAKEDIRKRTIRDMVLLLFAGIVYYLIVSYTPFGLRCYFLSLFGLKCPSCGVTRMAVSAVHFDFKSAFGYNPYIFVTLPYIIYEITYLFYLNESKKKMNRINMIILCVWIGLLIIFGIFRNIYNW